MRVVIQRVSNASVTIDNTIFSEINAGLLLLLGIEDEDTQEDIEWLLKKTRSMRIFNDTDAKMNLSLEDVAGEVLVVSQFTLHASTKKGNRPSFIKSARPEIAIPLYEKFIELLKESSLNIQTGVFGANMKVSLTNDGPVTICLDSKRKE